MLTTSWVFSWPHTDAKLGISHTDAKLGFVPHTGVKLEIPHTGVAPGAQRTRVVAHVLVNAHSMI